MVAPVNVPIPPLFRPPRRPAAAEKEILDEYACAILVYRMVSMEQIEAFTSRVVSEFQPKRILLFGSYARGEQHADSDVDLLIIMSFIGKPAAKSAEIRLRARPAFPVDLIVRTPGAVEERLAMGDGFIRDALEHGKVLYEADHG